MDTEFIITRDYNSGMGGGGLQEEAGGKEIEHVHALWILSFLTGCSIH